MQSPGSAGALTTLRVLAALMAALLAAGELARRWNTETFLPLALDDLLVAFLLAWASWRAGHRGPAPLLLAWGAFLGLVLVLLALNSAPLFAGEPKPGAAFYTATLLLMLALGSWAAWRAMRLLPGPGADKERA